MEKKNVVKRGGNAIALTIALAVVLSGSSCKKDAQINPGYNSTGIENLNQAGSGAIRNTVSNLKVSAPVSLVGAHDMTISGDSINGGTHACISLVSCYNIHITNCKLVNSSQNGVNLSACSHITIDDCSMSNVAAGVYAFGGRDITVINNKMKDIISDPRTGSALVVFENLGNDASEAASNSAVNNTLVQ
jgi:parallel beta-helix repeat protein